MIFGEGGYEGPISSSGKSAGFRSLRPEIALPQYAAAIRKSWLTVVAWIAFLADRG